MRKSKIILFYNTMWEQPLSYPVGDIPEPYILTTERRALDEAVAVVFHLPSFPEDVILTGRPIKKKGQLWVAWAMECEVHYPQMNDPVFMNNFDLKMTYRLASDIAVPYVEYGYGELLRRPPGEKEDGNIINAFVSSPYNKSGRLEYLMRMMRVLDIHSYGELIRNRTAADDNGRTFKMDTISRYKFTLAFENAIARDYVTEKFYDPLIAGSVPVYLGAPNIADFAPGEKCFINVSDWDNPESLAQYLLDVSGDEALYRSFFEWKKEPFLSKFAGLLGQLKEHAFVRLCREVEEAI